MPIAIQLLSRAQTIILILNSAALLAAIATFFYSKFWLKPLQALEEEIATIAENPDQILAPPPDTNAPPALVKAQSRLRVLHSKGQAIYSPTPKTGRCRRSGRKN